VFTNPGFFGRMDDVQLFAELENGKTFVVELNGAASEPTHIYDPKHLFLHGRN
jgi:hypothetical protein